MILLYKLKGRIQRVTSTGALGRAFQGPSRSRPAGGRLGGAGPGSGQPRQPIRFTSERDHEEPDRQPVAISRTRFEMIRSMLEKPAQVFHAPLVGTDLPATIERRGDGAGSPQVCVNGRSPSTR